MACVRWSENRGRYIADWRDRHRIRHRESAKGPFKNKTAEKRATDELLYRRLAEDSKGTYSSEALSLRFSDLATRYLESKVNIRPSTHRSYEGLITLYLNPYFGPLKIREISPADIESFRNELSRKLPTPIIDAFAKRIRDARPALSHARAKRRAKQRKIPSTSAINKLLTLLVMIFNYACRNRWVEFNPAEYVERLRVREFPDVRTLDANVLAPDEIRRLIDAAEPMHFDSGGSLKSNNYRLILQVAIFTGMRSGELKALRWDDVDWVSSQISIQRSYKEGQFHAPKTKTSSRMIEVPALLIRDLQKWRLACPNGELDLIFPNLAGNPLSNANLLQRGFYPALRRAGLRKIRFHDLRHTFASLMIANGEDIVRVSRLLGHASPKITLDVYSHMLPNEHYGSADRLAELVYESNVDAG